METLDPATSATAPSRRRRLIVRTATSLLVTVALLGLAAMLVDLGEIAASIARFEPHFLLPALVLLPGPVVCRWLRLAVGIGRAPQWRLFRASALHGAALAILPAKLGELVLPLALNRFFGISLAEAAGLLLLIRVCDILMLLVLCGISVAAIASPLGLLELALPAVAAAAASLLAVLLMPHVARAVRVLLLAQLARWPRLAGVAGQLTAAAAGLTLRRTAALAGATLAVWASVFALFHVVSLGLGVEKGVLSTVTAGGAASLAFALPVNGVANVGPFEAAWAGVLIRLGVGAELALAVALAGHAGMVLAHLLAAGLAVVFPGRERR